ncbi:MAG: hypothetical protein K9N35_11650 [Candidatus Marinimicrobia bacterium]|nr:hypothetical protein [Candidatus Neomarinimicrobiota bacterium]
MHPISEKEVITTFYHENLLPMPGSKNAFLFWDSTSTVAPDTIRLISDFTHTNWIKPSVDRVFWSPGSEIMDTSAAYDIYPDPIYFSVEELAENTSLSSIDSVQSYLRLLENLPDSIGVTVLLTDMAGNQFIDERVYPLVPADGDPVHEHLFNYPNPFNPRAGASTSISFLLKRDSPDVSFIILDASGTMVKHFEKNDLLAGRHELPWDGKNMWGETCASGVYFGVLDVKDLPQVYVKILIVNK